MSDEGATVFIIDDDPSVRKAVERLLRLVGFRVHAFASAQAFLEHEVPDVPRCLVLDVQMPGLNGLELQRALQDAHIHLPIVFLTGHGDIPMTVRALKAGATDFLPKPFDDQQLIDAVRQAIASDVEARRTSAATAAVRRRFEALTPREREVMALVVTGMLNKQVARQLGIAEKTIKLHRARVMEKMQADSFADLVRMAEKLGIQPLLH